MCSFHHSCAANTASRHLQCHLARLHGPDFLGTHDSGDIRPSVLFSGLNTLRRRETASEHPSALVKAEARRKPHLYLHITITTGHFAQHSFLTSPRLPDGYHVQSSGRSCACLTPCDGQTPARFACLTFLRTPSSSHCEVILAGLFVQKSGQHGAC
jgi:hypothetical protein